MEAVRYSWEKIQQSGRSTDVLAGEEDQLFPTAHSMMIADLLPVQVRSLPGIGHIIHLEAPLELAKGILDSVGQA